MRDSDSTGQRVGRLRWLMIFMVFIIATVAYLDRSNVSIAASFIKRDFSLNNYQLGFVFSIFVFAYGLTQPFAGRLTDRLGAYKVVCIGIFWWCALTVLTASIPAHIAGAFGILLGVRLALGVGESMLFPAGSKLVSNWIPTQERGLAQGIIFAGVGIGSGIAPPLITTIMLAYGWRAAFWISGGIGLVAMAAWMLLVRETPAVHPWIGAAEAAHIKAGLTKKSDTAGEILPWKTIILDRNVMLMTASYFCFAYVAYIFFTWFFTYLSVERGLDLKSSGNYGALPFLAMAVASPFGGWIADRLTRSKGKRIGRCLFAAASMALAAVFVALATLVKDAHLAVLVLAGGSGTLYLAQSAFWALSADLGRGSAGSVAGFINMGGQLGGALVAAATPFLADALGWDGSFLFTAGIALVGALCWLPVDPHAVLSSQKAD